jgi:hypothetical protein
VKAGNVYSLDLVERRRILVVPVLVVGALVAQAGLAGPAEAAAVRYTSPTGSGTACSSTVPCSLVTGVNNAAASDEVVVATGTYNLAATALSNLTATNLNVHGVVGQPRPVINSSASIGLELKGDGARVADLTINHTGSLFGLNVFANNILVQRLEVHSTAPVSCGLGYIGLARDLTCVDTAASGIALDDSWNAGTGLLTLRNVTAVATGTGSYGIRAAATNSNTNLDINARNVIASGTLADVRATATGTSSDSDVALQNSNYDVGSATGTGVTVTAAGSGTNQTAAPLFGDATAYHQQLGSPTIDKGATDASVGTTDIDGGARKVGIATDIGADEFVPDTTPPDTAFDHTVKRKTHKHKAIFTFHASEAATFTCVVDKRPTAPCSSPYKVRFKKRGKHTLTVIATDAVGNVDPTPASYTWKIRKKKKKKRHHG